ncbi:hypothetical protein BGX27_004023 [Mortierella sp. AM989]|nr:hypothetical protein BGX27_004023 [Mortierella sp. AM989]
MEMVSQDITQQYRDSNKLFDAATVDSFASIEPSLYHSTPRSPGMNECMSYGATMTPLLNRGICRDVMQQEPYQELQQISERNRPTPMSLPMATTHHSPISSIESSNKVAPPCYSVASSKSSNLRGSRSLYSMPHFRFSTLPSFASKETERITNGSDATYYIPDKENGSQILQDWHFNSPGPETTPPNHEGFIDDHGFDPSLPPVIAGPVVSTSATPCYSNLASPEDQPEYTTNVLIRSVVESRNQDRQDVNIDPFINVDSQESPLRETPDEMTSKEGRVCGRQGQPPPVCTFFDKIHKIGSEIKSSAAATVPHFGTICATTRYKEREQERRSLRQKSRFDISAKHSTSLFAQAPPQPDLLQHYLEVDRSNLENNEGRSPVNVLDDPQGVIAITEDRAIATGAVGKKATEPQTVLTEQSYLSLLEILGSNYGHRTCSTLIGEERGADEPDSDLERISVLEQEIQYLTKH